MKHKSLQTIDSKSHREEPSVAIICLNVQETIQRALESVKGFKEIVIVDNGSTDKTLAIVRRYTKKIYINKIKNLRLLREFALTKLTSAWVLFIDADEFLINKNIVRLLDIWRKKHDQYDGFWLARRNYYGNGENDYLKHCLFYPDFQLRLFKKMYRYINTPHEAPSISPGQTYYCREVEIYHRQDKRKLFSIFGIKYLFPLTKIYGQNFTDRNVIWLLFNAVYRFCDLFFVSLTRGKGILDGYLGIMAAFNFACHVSLIYLYALYLKIRRKNN